MLSRSRLMEEDGRRVREGSFLLSIRASELKPVTHPVNRLDKLRLIRVCFQLRSQARDVIVHRPGRRERCVTPNSI